MRGLPNARRRFRLARSHTVDLSGLLAGSRQRIIIDDEIPLEPFEGIAFARPLTVHLEVQAGDGVIELRGDAKGTASAPCVGCLEEVVRRVEVPIDERLDPNVGRQDDPFGEGNVLVGGRLDIADLTQQVLLGVLPMGLRCSENCRGLCGICGINKNASECSCETGEERGEPKMENPPQQNT